MTDGTFCKIRKRAWTGTLPDHVLDERWNCFKHERWDDTFPSMITKRAWAGIRIDKLFSLRVCMFWNHQWSLRFEGNKIHSSPNQSLKINCLASSPPFQLSPPPSPLKYTGPSQKWNRQFVPSGQTVGSNGVTLFLRDHHWVSRHNPETFVQKLVGYCRGV